jgi:hypothetical protein
MLQGFVYTIHPTVSESPPGIGPNTVVVPSTRLDIFLQNKGYRLVPPELLGLPISILNIEYGAILWRAPDLAK